jgi:hypothetical protein
MTHLAAPAHRGPEGDLWIEMVPEHEHRGAYASRDFGLSQPSDFLILSPASLRLCKYSPREPDRIRSSTALPTTKAIRIDNF